MRILINTKCLYTVERDLNDGRTFHHSDCAILYKGVGMCMVLGQIFCVLIWFLSKLIFFTIFGLFERDKGFLWIRYNSVPSSM